MRFITRIGIVGLAAMLAGCFSGNGSLYGGATPLRPFHDGAVITRDSDGKTGHFALKLEAGNVYRFTITDRGDDFGEGYRLRFFALPGAPAATLVFEAAEVCKASDKHCDPAPKARFFGLVRVTRRGAEEINPKCTKDDAFAKLPGVKIEDYDTCSFRDRAALEKALLAVVARNPKADAVYSFAN